MKKTNSNQSKNNKKNSSSKTKKKVANSKKQSTKLELQKNNYKFVIIGVILLIFVYFFYKGIALCVYNHIPINNYREYISWLEIKDTIKITQTASEENIIYSNLKMKNDFKNFKYINSENTDIYETEIDGKKTSIMLSKSQNIIDMFKEDSKMYDFDIETLLKEENINDDLDLFKYLYDTKDDTINIFTKTKIMKEFHTKRNLAYAYIPQGNEIVKITGDYEGYIFKLSSSVEVNIIKDSQRYTIKFANRDYFTDEYIEKLINTVSIS